MRRKAMIGIECMYAVLGKTFGTWVFAKNLVEEITSLDTRNQHFIFLNPLAASDFRRARDRRASQLLAAQPRRRGKKVLEAGCV